MANAEYWLRGPVDGVLPLLQPVAHALLQACDDVIAAAEPLNPAQLWERPGDAASVGYHLKHLVGSLDRLLTYARGEQLSADQLAWLKTESVPEDPAIPGALISTVRTRFDAALDQVKRTPESSLLQARQVGRQGLPSTTIGLLFHAAEHAARHAGQIVTTAKIVTHE